ncbi:MAG TPA: sigma-70 family RNA polymerase sigma factor [Bacteroidales bacterium]|nr:sigma-70 family RNA polymerase sigma factor [Bacteroidales bacterium]HPS16728.1 sigma-70 family RNA polymerase sigma factor [Bacteroidales bacterium]
MKAIKDEDIITGIRNKERHILEYLYKSYYYDIRGRIVKKFQFKEEEAEDLFQDALIIMYKKIIDNELNLTCSFKTYFFSVINLMLQKRIKLQNRRKEILESIFETSGNTDAGKLSSEEILFELEPISEMKRSLFWKKFKELPADCKKILINFFDNIALREIARIIGHSSENYTKKRKHLCQEALIKKIKNDNQYKIIRKYEDKE